MFKITPGDTVEIFSIVIGTQPLSVTWQHNDSRVVNQTILNDTNFLLSEVIHTGMMFSKLTITNVGEDAQGVYKVVANNTGGQVESEEAQLVLGEFAKPCTCIVP